MKHQELEQPFVLKELVAYREHQINSKHLSLGESKDVVLFALAENESISSESSPTHKLLYLLDGQLEVILDGKSMILQAEQSILIPQNTIHVLQAIGQCKFIQI